MSTLVADSSRSTATHRAADLTWRSLSLQERRLLLDEVQHASSADPDASQVDVWKERIGATGPDAHLTWERRLEWDGLTPEEAAWLTGPRPEALFADAGPPDWLCTLRTVYDAASTSAPNRSDRVLVPDEPAVFEELYVPLIQFARNAVQQQTGDDYAAFSEQAHVHFERGLLRRLSDVYGQAVYSLFTTFRAQRTTSVLTSMLGSGPAHTGHSLYETFLEFLLGRSLRPLVDTYPVGARLCVMVTEMWIDFAVEAIRRFSADRTAIEHAFFDGEPLGPVCDLDLDMGDAHGHGQTVLIFVFDGNRKVVYKPRPVGLENAFENVVGWLNAEMDEVHHLKAAKSLQRETYGWIEFIRQDECTSLDEVACFYRRLGSLLGTVYCLSGNDFHFENVIASGEHPVLVDMEALLTPYFHEKSLGTPPKGEAMLTALEKHGDSVVATGLLPSIKKITQDVILDFGGMGGAATDDVEIPIARWRHINRDTMQLTYETIDMGLSGNLPRLDGEPQYAAPYVDEILEGFTEVYRRFWTDHASFEAEVRPHFEGRYVRYILRATSLYHKMASISCHPRYLRDGAARSLLFELLSLPLVQSRTKSPLWDLFQAEQRSLGQMDIPLFHTRVDDRAISSMDEVVVSSFFSRSAAEQRDERLASLSQSDLAFQSELIRRSLISRSADGLRPPVAPSRPSPSPEPASAERTGGSAFDRSSSVRDLAIRVGEELLRRAVRTAGEAVWHGARHVPDMNRYVVGPTGSSLFSGGGGMALFSGALWRATGRPAFKDLAYAALLPLRRAASIGDALETLGIDRRTPRFGLGEGLGEGLVTLSHASRILDDPALIDDALTWSTFVTDASIASVDRANVFGGAAGLILGLLALYRETESAALLDKAEAAARRALDLGVAEADETTETTGLLLGPSGVAAALLRLSTYRQDPDVIDAALQLLERDEDRLAHTGRAGWATGLAGLGLAQLCALPLRGRTDELYRTIDSLASAPLAPTDDLATGALGPVAVLQRAAAHLGDETLDDHVRDTLASIVLRATESGRVDVGWGEHLFLPSLYQGTPGSCYVLLQLTEQPDLPCPLSWQ